MNNEYGDLLRLVPSKVMDAVMDALATGQVIAHPTETVFGLAADPFNPAAIKRLLLLKGRSSAKGFILLIPDRTWLERLILPPSPLAQKLMAHFWPGPLTLVLPARSNLSAEVTGSSGFVAVRHSPSPLIMELLHAWQKPLASTSANLADQRPLCCTADVRQQWGDAIAIVLDGHSQPGAIPSTLLHVEAGRARLLRTGAVSIAQLQDALPELELHL